MNKFLSNPSLLVFLNRGEKLDLNFTDFNVAKIFIDTVHFEDRVSLLARIWFTRYRKRDTMCLPKF